MVESSKLDYLSSIGDESIEVHLDIWSIQ